MYFVYMLECGDGTLYTGITTDTERRFQEHARGVGSRGARYTGARKPRKMVYIEEHSDRSAASKREAEIKRLTRKEKLALIG